MLAESNAVRDIAGVFAQDPLQATLPDIQIRLLEDVDTPSQCDLGLDTFAQIILPETDRINNLYVEATTLSTRNNSTGRFTEKYLFHNFEACIGSISSLANIRSIGFFSKSADVSFCLQDFSLLPTEVPSAGELFYHASRRFCFYQHAVC